MINEHPRYEEAYLEAAGHFLSDLNNLNAAQIWEALMADDEETFRNSGIVLWDALRLDREDVADHIETLAESFVRFLEK